MFKVTETQLESHIQKADSIATVKAGVTIGSAVVAGMAAGAVGGPGDIVLGAIMGLVVGAVSFAIEDNARNDGTLDAIKDDYEAVFYNQVENWEEQHMIYREYGCA